MTRLVDLKWTSPARYVPSPPAGRAPDREALGAWLEARPAIADAMVGPPVVKPPPFARRNHVARPGAPVVGRGPAASPRLRGVHLWPSSLKALLAENVADYWAWYAGGREGDDPTPVRDPPQNRAQPHDDWRDRTVLAPADLARLYVKTVANSLVVEMLGLVPWSLMDMAPSERAALLSAASFYRQVDPGGRGYELTPSLDVIPPPPLTAVRFLDGLGVPCVDMAQTVGRVLRWCHRLQHALSEPANPQWDQDLWGYPGVTPTTRILSGTEWTGGTLGRPPSWAHWTYGCGTTVAFLQAVLRAVNVPVTRAAVIDPFNNALHAAAIFGHAGVLTHGDCPYIGLDDLLPYPGESLLLPEGEFRATHPNDVATPRRQIGWSSTKLQVEVGTRALVLEWFRGRRAGKSPDECLAAAFWTAPPSLLEDGRPTLDDARAAGTAALFEAYLADYPPSDPTSEGRLRVDLQRIPRSPPDPTLP